jgi:flagellar hook-length control protein FliK
METQMAVIKENLNQQGIKVEAVEVSVGTHEFERNLEEGQTKQEQASDQSQQGSAPRRTNINLNNLDELSGLMTDEEALVASMMRDAGNSINFTA